MLLKIPLVNHPPDSLRRQFRCRTHFCGFCCGLFCFFLFNSLILKFIYFILVYRFPYSTKYFSLCIQQATFRLFWPIKSYTLSIRPIVLPPLSHSHRAKALLRGYSWCSIRSTYESVSSCIQRVASQHTGEAGAWSCTCGLPFSCPAAALSC